MYTRHPRCHRGSESTPTACADGAARPQFVVVANLCWAALYLVSRCVSGAVLAQLLLSLLLTVPALLLHWLPPGTSDRLRLLAEEATRTLQSWGQCRRRLLLNTSRNAARTVYGSGHLCARCRFPSYLIASPMFCDRPPSMFPSPPRRCLPAPPCMPVSALLEAVSAS